ncbi:MAG TPA: helix-turn-helix domain-containing protein [Flavisolibacter sp.]|jgi:transcriptional regulator with XRE-family HTH domain|nr:helix-turn-helix domain-containing protein [Flavisolibacter sp.]
MAPNGLLAQKIITARKRKGLTQEELADLAGVTVRTIQRIESGDTLPRSFTLKALAGSLDLPFEELAEPVDAKAGIMESAAVPVQPVQKDTGETSHFLQLLCLSCFTYLLLPYLHFLIPQYLLRKKTGLSPEACEWGRKLIRTQIIWIITLNGALLAGLCYNLLIDRPMGFHRPVSYVALFFLMYLINAVIITLYLGRSRKWTLQL